MKRAFIILVFLPFSFAYGQQLEYGIVAGFYLSTLDNEGREYDYYQPLPGGRLGGIFKLDLSDQFKVKTELAYSMTGAKTPGYHIRLHNVSVPVSFVYSPIEFVNIEAGAEVNLIIDATTNAAIDYASLFDKFDFGLNLGL